jgi:outer membrane protein
MRSWCGGCAILIVCLAPVSAALAQGVLYAPDQQPSAWNIEDKPVPWDINLAAGAAMQPTFHGSDRYRATPIPLVVIRWHDTVSLGAEGLSLYWRDNNFRIGGGVNYEGGRLDHETSGLLSSGDNRLKGLGDIDASVGLRVFAAYRLGPVYWDISATKYLGPQNKGVLVNLGGSAPFALTQQLIFRPHIGATWADDNTMQTFFGVSSLQAARTLFPRFNAGSGLEDINGGLTMVYLLNSHWFWGIDATATRYLDDAARSPITMSRTNATMATVIGYHF